MLALLESHNLFQVCTPVGAYMLLWPLCYASISVGPSMRAHIPNCAQDKRQQTSDWQVRPLSHAQQVYAALDALCLVAIFHRAVAPCTATPLEALCSRLEWSGDGVVSPALLASSFISLRLHHHAVAASSTPADAPGNLGNISALPGGLVR